MKTALWALGFILGPFFIQTSPVAFQSRESKTATGGPVFNRVQFLPGTTEDIWLMQQYDEGDGPLALSESADAHGEVFRSEQLKPTKADQIRNSFNPEENAAAIIRGDKADFKTWDRLKIVVDKTTKPYVAKFYQLNSGELSPEGHLVPFKAQCFRCHTNGPRALRPETKNLGLWNRAKVWAWNARIKTYGIVTSEAAEGVPTESFKSSISVLLEELPLKTCKQCHSKDGIRSALTLANSNTAAFLVRQGEMPPFPWKATAEEIRLLEKFASKF